MKIFSGSAALAISLLAVCSASAAEDQASPPKGYALVWADEFDGKGLPDAGKWVYDTEANATGWYNNELQYYAAQRLANSHIENGKLSIVARKEKLTSKADYGGQKYSSARLITNGKAGWTYGYFEVRAKLPCGKGTWPAFWMLGPDHIPWPDNGEIDIMEQVGKEPTKITGTIHTSTSAKTVGIGGETVIKDACKSYHTYQTLWTPEKISIGVDGHDYFEYRNDGKGKSTWPFDTPHYLLINLAIGGDMAGSVDNRIFPVKLDIDHIRVYQKK